MHREVKCGDYVRSPSGSLAKVIKVTNRRGRQCKMVLNIFLNRFGIKVNDTIVVKISNYGWEVITPAYLVLFGNKNCLTDDQTIDKVETNPCLEIFDELGNKYSA